MSCSDDFYLIKRIQILNGLTVVFFKHCISIFSQYFVQFILLPFFRLMVPVPLCLYLSFSGELSMLCIRNEMSGCEM